MNESGPLLRSRRYYPSSRRSPIREGDRDRREPSRLALASYFYFSSRRLRKTAKLKTIKVWIDDQGQCVSSWPYEPSVPRTVDISYAVCSARAAI
jgi:hypothetical protein